ncbi:MAG: cytochrome c peroxidase [Pseudomonadota bacterium]|nr:cytochrome c peroxidase [Pseudomonadota bacterium]
MALEPVERLGKSIFFDKNLSLRKNQACASCHAGNTGFSGPRSGINRKAAVYPGSVKTRFGNRKPPTAAYATLSPILHYIIERGDTVFVGGNFFDGRATGEKLGNPAADQAQAPFLNPVEQALPDAACVVHRVCNAKRNRYPVKLEDVYPESCNISWPSGVNKRCKAGETLAMDPENRGRVDTAFDNIALAIAAFESSPKVNRFSSKFDAVLAGEAEFTTEEEIGQHLFMATAACADCHPITRQENGGPPLFTDSTFDNLGVPKNPQNPAYKDDPDFVDRGLGGFLETRDDYMSFADENIGKQKVPTLRNVDKRPGKGFTKSYMHNGFFKTLEGVVHFYNTRDVKPSCESLGIFDATEAVALANDCWPKPEVAVNVNFDELGDLELSASSEAAIVAFLKTLSDGYVRRSTGTP